MDVSVWPAFDRDDELCDTVNIARGEQSTNLRLFNLRIVKVSLLRKTLSKSRNERQLVIEMLYFHPSSLHILNIKSLSTKTSTHIPSQRSFVKVGRPRVAL